MNIIPNKGCVENMEVPNSKKKKKSWGKTRKQTINHTHLFFFVERTGGVCVKIFYF